MRTFEHKSDPLDSDLFQGVPASFLSPSHTSPGNRYNKTITITTNNTSLNSLVQVV